MVEPNLKEAVKAMCKAYPGGREAMAGALGMTVTQFNNNLYEKNGCRFFEVSELEAMEDISIRRYWLITSLAVVVLCWWMFRTWKSWIAWTCLAGQCVPLPPEGRLIRLSNRHLKMALLKGMRPKKSWCIIAATWQLVKKRLPQSSRFFTQRSDASELQLLASWRVVISGDY